MKKTTGLCLAAALLGAALPFAAGAASIKIDSVKQHAPNSGRIDITYTVKGAQDLARKRYAKIVFTAKICGNNYSIGYQIDGDSVGADASDGTFTVTWTPPSRLGAKALDCTMTAELFASEVPSGNDFMIINLATGEVTYEGRYSTLAPSLERYNKPEYKTTKMVLREIPRWSDRASLPNAAKLPEDGYPTGPGQEKGDYNVARFWRPTRNYYMALFPTTQKQYEIVCGRVPAQATAGDAVPVNTGVSWYDLRRPEDDDTDFSPAMLIPPSTSAKSGTFFQRLNYKTGLYFDLPTEIMFEIALRAGSTATYSWGSSMDNAYIVCKDDEAGGFVDVGTKLPNNWGLYDMNGLVFEWMRDCGKAGKFQITKSYPTSAFAANPNGHGTFRRIKGGDWRYPSVGKNDTVFKASNRDNNFEAKAVKNIGFRVSMVVY